MKAVEICKKCSFVTGKGNGAERHAELPHENYMHITQF
jgi:hypothetical protein